MSDFRIEKTDKNGKVMKVIVITGMDTFVTKDGSIKLKPSERNAAALKGLLTPNSKLLGTILNTSLPVWLRRLDDGFRGTLTQAVEKASAGTSRQSIKDAKIAAARAALEYIPKAKQEKFLESQGLTFQDLEEGEGEGESEE